MATLWAIVPDYPNYEISTDGVVRRRVNGSNRLAGAVIKPFTRPNGYVQIHLCKDKRRKRFLVHCLVAATFLGPKPEGMEVAHGDGVRGNNSLGNLSYKTHIDNELDKQSHGTRHFGEKIGNSRLTNAQVSKIKAALAAGVTQTSLALKHGVHVSTVNLIASNKTWRDIPAEAAQ